MDRRHAAQIRNWADYPEAQTWVRQPNSKTWEIIEEPSFLSKCDYCVVPKEYQEAWEIYLDGELEVLGNSGTYFPFNCTQDPPTWMAPVSHYRRMPLRRSTDPMVQRFSGDILIIRDTAGDIISVRWEAEDGQ